MEDEMAKNGKDFGFRVSGYTVVMKGYVGIWILAGGD